MVIKRICYVMLCYHTEVSLSSLYEVTIHPTPTPEEDTFCHYRGSDSTEREDFDSGQQRSECCYCMVMEWKGACNNKIWR